MLGTETSFKFKTYKILGQDEAALSRSKNPFAFVILTALLALKKRKKNKKNDEDELLQLKIALARRLLEQKFPMAVIRVLLLFIRNFVVLEKEENNRKFDSTIDSITEKNKTMGIVELLRERQIKAPGEEYMEKGIEKGKATFVANLLNANKFTIPEIANFAGVSEAYVRKIKKTLN